MENTIIQIINWVESRRVSILQKITVKLIVIQIVQNETNREKENTLRRKQKQKILRTGGKNISLQIEASKHRPVGCLFLPEGGLLFLPPMIPGFQHGGPRLKVGIKLGEKRFLEEE